MMSIKEQNRILALAKRNRTPLVEALALFGKTVDDLVYEHSRKEFWEGGKPLSLDDFRGDRHQIPMVSFFSGCGGIDIGFEAAGFKHLAAFEINEHCCKTLRKNRPEWSVFGPPGFSGDISKLSEAIATLESVIPIPFEGVFAGGPPCQPFSVASNQTSRRTGFADKKRGGLLFDYISIIRRFRPLCFLIENVPGLRTLDGGKQLSAIVKDLGKAGYEVHSPVVLNAVDYGAPQVRRRLFLAGTRRKRRQARFPKPVAMKYGAGSMLAEKPVSGANTETRNHRPETVMRYAGLNYGQRCHVGRIYRLSPCHPSKTVIAGGTNGGGRSHLHPEIPRSLSVRENARLQTFPDCYVFEGPVSRQFTQVGNAVPPVLAAQIGRSLAKSVFGVNSR